MHVFVHPELWMLYVRWRRRSMPGAAIAKLSTLALIKGTKRALKRLRSYCRIRALVPFFDGQRLQLAFSDWSRETDVRLRFTSTRLLFPFRQESRMKCVRRARDFDAVLKTRV